MRQPTQIEYDVSSLRKVSSLPQLCMLATRAYENIASAMWKEDMRPRANTGCIILAAGPHQCVPLPTHIDFRNLGVFIRIVYMAEIHGNLEYLTHINARYADGVWMMIPGTDDVACCETDAELAMECAVSRLRTSMKSMCSTN